jgi:centromere/kinetochore protein ZW10
MEKSTRAMRLLSSKCAELEQFIHKQFSSMWMLLVAVDQSKNTLTIQQKIPDLDTDISHALQGLEAFQETHEAARKLWADIDTMIIRPRTLMSHANIPAVQIGEVN